MLLTRPPRDCPESQPVRLACIRHAASVDPEPGSNSPPKVDRDLNHNSPCRQDGRVLIASVPLNRRTVQYHVWRLPSSRSFHCPTTLLCHAPSSTPTLNPQRFVSFSRCLAAAFAVRRTTEPPHFIGADSAHAHDQSPDLCEWIVMDDLQSAILRFRCHATPFGRDNCRLFAGSAENTTGSLR